MYLWPKYPDMLKKVVFFASGNGSNVQRIVEYFAGNPEVSFQRVYCNKPDAYVLQRANQLNIPNMVITRKQFYESNDVLKQLLEDAPDLIVLAGFLWLLPLEVIASFDQKIINIHPALLPAYGGKGMYGSKVHEAVIDAGEKESGITIHYVNEKYDEGKTLLQAKCPIFANDTPETLAQRIHKLEYEYFPKLIESLLKS